MKEITKQSLTEIVSLAELKFSPNGKKIAYTKNMLSEENNNYTSDICVFDLDTQEHILLTTANSDKDIIWMDDSTIMFQSKRKSVNNRIDEGLPTSIFYTISLNGGEAKKLFEIPLEVKGLTVLSNSLYAFISRVPYSLENEFSLEDADKYAKESKNNTFTIFDELPFWSNGEGIVNKTRKGVFVFDAKTEKVKQISPKDMNIDNFSMDKTNNKLYFFGTRYSDIYTKKSELYVYDYKDNKCEEIQLNPKLYVSAIFPTTNELVIYGLEVSKTDSFSNSKFYTYRNNELERLNDLDISVGSSVGSDCRYGKGKSSHVDDYIWYIRAERVDTGIFRLVNGVEENIVALGKGAITDFTIIGNQLAYIGVKNQGLQELYYVDLTTNIETRLTSYNDDFIKNHNISEVEYTTFKNRQKVDLDSFVLKPTNYDISKKYPALLYVRGGPKGISGDNFFHELQWFANNGYFVFYTNPRGSDGRGSDFANIEGDRYGNWDYEDLLDLVEYVTDSYTGIDKTRLGIMGGSYGGFMTNWVVGHTDIFKAAVTQRSIANYVTKCLTTDIGYYHNINQMGSKTLWEDIDTYWDHSPLKYADRVKTPLLFIHSDEDYRCYMGDALQYFSALKLHGVETRFCLFHKENHELSRSGKPSNRYKRLDEIMDWMNKYLK